MRLADPVAVPWRAQLSLHFERQRARTLLAKKRSEGPLVVQKALYPEGDAVCHAIVVHPPGGIAGGDELELDARVSSGAHALITTPGAAKWYRSAGPWASQRLGFEVEGTLEWLPRETIVFDGALAGLTTNIRLATRACFIGWEIVCLGRTGSAETYSRGELRVDTTVSRGGRRLLAERGGIPAGGRLMHSPAGLGGNPVFGTMLVASSSIDEKVLKDSRSVESVAVTLLPGLLVARYLGDSTEQAFAAFVRLWRILRPAMTGREAVEPRIWRT